MRAALLSVVAGLLLAAAAPAPQTAERFVRMLYANEANDQLTMSGWTWQRYLSSRTAALQRRYEAARSGDADRYLDYDWLCQCQDSGGFRIASIATAPGARGTTVATVRFGRNQGVRLILVNERGWKIDDIIDAHGMRYSAALQYNIRRAGR
ncbi:hypothetical protein GCM10023232_08860 [Sphingosinicella ginsenosidimutans]|nr:DUF3828 domain-containing protein [Sphingosinicella ginsenosidimutans]